MTKMKKEAGRAHKKKWITLQSWCLKTLVMRMDHLEDLMGQTKCPNTMQTVAVMTDREGSTDSMTKDASKTVTGKEDLVMTMTGQEERMTDRPDLRIRTDKEEVQRRVICREDNLTMTGCLDISHSKIESIR